MGHIFNTSKKKKKNTYNVPRTSALNLVLLKETMDTKFYFPFKTQVIPNTSLRHLIIHTHKQVNHQSTTFF